mgnify:CR=1 FL=1
MAGMSNSEYARHKAKQENQGNFIYKVLALVLLIIFVPSLVIPFIGFVFVAGLLWSMITDGLVKEDRY